MNTQYVSLQLRGGSKEEHLTGNNTGFVGQAKEVTVDTTDWKLRVHDGHTVGGIPTVMEGEPIPASLIVFEDGDTLQTKFNNGELGGGGGGEILPPPTNTKPSILAVDVKNKLQNGTATIMYYVKDLEQTEFIHRLSVNNGNSFTTIVPKGENPYEYIVEGLSLGQNLCAIQVSDGEYQDTKYFIVNIPNENIDTAPVIQNVIVTEINTSGFKVKYTVYDKEDDSIQQHNISVDNGYSYTQVYPMLVEGSYEANVTNLVADTEYFCRIKVKSNNLESLTYGFNVHTSQISR